MRALLMALLLFTGAARAAESVATFAGGCFWCMESDFEKVPGVLSVTSGYTGGPEPDPTYAAVSAHRTGHAEGVEVRFDPAKVTYDQLLDHFWHNVDPVTADAQFCDHGRQYRTAIFFHDTAQKAAAAATKAKYEKQLGKTFATQIVAAGKFYLAEGYHQDYYKKNPVRYKYYRFTCGRDQALEKIWGKAVH